nr:unnamed protein product [Callosobruchus analis]
MQQLFLDNGLLLNSRKTKFIRLNTHP